MFVYPTGMRTWEALDPDFHRPIAAPLEQCGQLLGIDLATLREAAAAVEPYLRADGTKVWSLMQLERHFRPEAFGRPRGGYVSRRRSQHPRIDVGAYGRLDPDQLAVLRRLQAAFGEVQVEVLDDQPAATPSPGLAANLTGTAVGGGGVLEPDLGQQRASIPAGDPNRSA
jgi:hypothetical protein